MNTGYYRINSEYEIDNSPKTKLKDILDEIIIEICGPKNHMEEAIRYIAIPFDVKTIYKKNSFYKNKNSNNKQYHRKMLQR